MGTLRLSDEQILRRALFVFERMALLSFPSEEEALLRPVPDPHDMALLSHNSIVGRVSED